MNARQTHLEYCRWVLEQSANDAAIPAGPRERLGQMAGRLGLEMSVIFSDVHSLTRGVMPADREQGASSTGGTPIVVEVKPARGRGKAVASCSGAYTNHRWMNGVCEWCGKPKPAKN